MQERFEDVIKIFFFYFDGVREVMGFWNKYILKQGRYLEKQTYVDFMLFIPCTFL
jgi:hypothetical protein